MKDTSILSYLTIRPYIIDTTKEIENFEEFLCKKLPPVYKTFYKTYHLGEDSFINREYFLYDANRKLLVSQSIVNLQSSNNLPELEQIFDLDSIKVVLSNYDDDGTYNSEIDSSLNDKKLLPIMKHDNAILITVGYGTDNQDEIYLYNTDVPEGKGRFIKLADDVFQYLRAVMVIDNPDQSQLYKKLYKKWGEDFWRVRE